MMYLTDYKLDNDEYIVGLKLAYEAQWSTYEEGASIQIYEDPAYSDMFYVREGAANPYHSGPYWEEPYLATEYDVMVLKEEWEQIQKENEEYWERNGGF
jgi:hypothetical protein